MEFDVLDHRSGLGVFDPIENARFELYTPDPLEPQPVSTDEFYFPVDSAVGFDTSAIEIPKLVSTVVRRQDGTMIADATAGDTQTFAVGEYLIELQSTPMKLYVAVDGPLNIRPGEGAVTVDFGGSCHARVGARSFHERPNGTITVTDDVEDTMAALSSFGSALKTTSCERSFPTLRGHPPLIERGDSFDVSGDVEKPETDVEIVLPPERNYVYPIASLAYYLGAEVVSGTDPRLVVNDFEHSLDGPDGYEKTVTRVLEQVFFLDCLTRTEGYYPVELHERQQVEPLVDLDFAELYGRSLADQLPTYLSVPFDVLEPHVPDWHLTTDVVPVAENVPALSYFADDLSLLRSPDHAGAGAVEPTPDAVDEFMRGTAATDEFTRGASDEPEWGDDEMFQVDPVDTVEHAWVGDGYPINANKVTLDSLRRKADRTKPDDSAIEVHVVCNDPQMAEENVVSEFYGLRDIVSYDVSIHNETTASELADLFESSADFLHYIGHVDEEGFRCRDGYLDAKSLDSVGVEAFLLNACRSYEQGATLVEKGSRGGVVTLAEVVDSAATKVGRALARLLNSGFSLRSALSIAKDEVLVSIEYMTIGDGGLTLCQGESGGLVKFEIRKDGNEYLLSHYSYPSSSYRIGSLATFIGEDTTRYLTSGLSDTFRMTKEELRPILDMELVPVEIEGKLHWSNEITLSEI